MPMDIFTTRKMLGVIETLPPANSFLRDTFFGNVQTYDTEKIEIDVVNGTRRMAPFVSGLYGGKVQERGGYSTNFFESPYVEPMFRSNAGDFLKRVPGEPVYGTQSPETRAAIQLGKDFAELERRITRREEWMCRSALFTGAIPIVGEGVDATLTFWTAGQSDAPYTALAAGAKWSAADTSDPFKDLEDARTKIMQKSGIAPDRAVMGSEAAAAFLANEKVQKLLDIRRIELGEIKPAALPNGVTYIGRIAKLGLDIYQYDEWFQADGSNDLTPMVPANTVLLGSSNAPTTMAYGVVSIANKQKEALEYYQARRVPHSWVQENPAGRMVQLKSRPLPIINQMQAFHVIKAMD